MSVLCVLTTVERREDAQKIARSVVDKRLAACVQIIGPINSLFWWEGRVEEAEEWLVLLKTTEAAYEKLEKFLRNVHPYTVPEIVAFPVVCGFGGYLRWVEEEVKNV